jgi:hypothetical protein
MSNVHTQIHKTHHGSDKGEATTFPLIVFSVINHGGYIQMSFCPRALKLGVPKFPELGHLAFWKAYLTFNDNLNYYVSFVIFQT